MRGVQRSCSTFEQQMKCLPTSRIHALLKRRLKPLNSLQIRVPITKLQHLCEPTFLRNELFAQVSEGCVG